MDYKKLLDSFTKSNTERKIKLAAKAGYENYEDYRAFLKSEVSTVSKEETIPTIHIVDILDCSGSMYGSKFRNALKGINTKLKELKKVDTVQYTHSFIPFSTNIKNLYYKKSLVDSLPSTNCGGATALYDAIGTALSTLAPTIKKEKVLVNIYTDGEENNSCQWNRKLVAALIRKLSTENFIITFIGTSWDTGTIIRDLNIDKSNTLSYDGTGGGLKEAMKATLDSTKVFSKKVKESKDVSKNFYKKIV